MQGPSTYLNRPGCHFKELRMANKSNLPVKSDKKQSKAVLESVHWSRSDWANQLNHFLGNGRCRLGKQRSDCLTHGPFSNMGSVMGALWDRVV